MLDMTRMHHLLRVNGARLKSWANSLHLVDCGAGITIHDLNRRLDDMGLAMINLGAIDNQTLSGAIATGTHGSGHELPALSGTVRSILLVAGGGRQYRIEPSDGITDPQRHQEQGVTLIQEDDAFYAALVHLGAFGVVVGYILEVRPTYWLLEQRVLDKWSNVERAAKEGRLLGKYPLHVGNKIIMTPVRSVFLMVNPYTRDEDNTCLVGRVFEVDDPVHRGILERTRNILTSIAVNTRIPYAATVHKANVNPTKIPGALESGMRMMQDKAYLSKSYKVLFQGFEFLAEKAYGAEFAYDLRQDTWLRAVRRSFDVMRQLAYSKGLYSPTLPSIRFVQRGRAFISPEYGMDAAFIGNPVLKEQHRHQEILDAMQDMHLGLGGRPHWGKMTNRLEGKLHLLRQWYPRMDDWHAQMRRFNPYGTFDNKFTERLSLTPGVSRRMPPPAAV
jgi:L-gulono-1,4-lactone dehydrogenase